MREQILEELYPLIADFIVKSKSARIKDKELARVRIGYANALAGLIRAYNGLLKDKEMEELMQELEDLKNEFAESKKRFEQS